MFNGSENFNDEFFKPFDLVGATAQNGTTWLDRTNYFQNEKRQGQNQPYGKIWEVLQANLFSPDHPYSWTTIGSMDDLNAASLEDVYEWFKTYYGPNNAVLVLAGDVSPEEAREKVELYFGDIPPGPPITKHEAWAPKLREDKRLSMQDRVPQARLLKTWVGPHWTSPDADLLQIAGAILSTGKSSRLYKRLVYEDQVATAVDATPVQFEIASFIGVDATAQPGGDLAAIEAAVDEELAYFLDKGPTRDEVDRAVTGLRADLVRGLEQIGGFDGKAQLLARNATYTGDPTYYKTSLQRMEKATPAAVRDAARRWHSAASFTLEVHPYPELAATSAGADRSSGPPMPDNFPEVDFDDFERGSLSNGLEVLVVTRDALPVVRFETLFDAGYAADASAKLGTANLVMTMLDEGTKKRTSLAISDELAALGAELGAASNLDQSTVTLSSLKENLDASLDVYADVILNPSFPDNELDRLKKQVSAGIKAEQSSPFQLALRLAPGLIYDEGHAYNMPLTGSGTEASVASITREDLVAFHANWFRPNNATMIVVGDTTLADIQPRLEALFRRWEPKNVPTKNIGPVEKNNAAKVVIVDRPEAEQSLIISAQLAPPRNNDDEFAIQAMNDVLGGAFSARINMNLREDKSWAYGAYTFILDGAGPRAYIGYAPVQTDKTAASMAELKREFVDIRSDRPPEDDELARAVAEDTLSLPGRWETASAVATSLAQMVRYGYGDDYWDTYAQSVRDLSLPQVVKAADRYVAPEQLVWIVVGDRDRIEGEVRALEFGEIEFLDVDGKPVED
jgi:zinc protease